MNESAGFGPLTSGIALVDGFSCKDRHSTAATSLCSCFVGAGVTEGLLLLEGQSLVNKPQHTGQRV